MTNSKRLPVPTDGWRGPGPHGTDPEVGGFLFRPPSWALVPSTLSPVPPDVTSGALPGLTLSSGSMSSFTLIEKELERRLDSTCSYSHSSSSTVRVVLEFNPIGIRCRTEPTRFGTTGPEHGTYITLSPSSPYLRFVTTCYDWIPRAKGGGHKPTHRVAKQELFLHSDEHITWKWMAWSLGRLLSFTNRGFSTSMLVSRSVLDLALGQTWDTLADQ